MSALHHTPLDTRCRVHYQKPLDMMSWQNPIFHLLTGPAMDSSQTTLLGDLASVCIISAILPKSAYELKYRSLSYSLEPSDWWYFV